MKSLKDFYEKNRVRWSTIDTAWDYNSLLKPFSFTINRFFKLKQLRSLPIRLVNQTLNTMKSLRDFYTNNPIESGGFWDNGPIDTAWNYYRLLKPFGYMVSNLIKLKRLKSIPIRLVNQALNAIHTIANFYIGQLFDPHEYKRFGNNANVIKNIIDSFGNTVDSLKKLKELRSISTKSISEITDCLNGVYSYYKNLTTVTGLDEKSEFTKILVDKFINMATRLQGGLSKIKKTEKDSIESVIYACSSIFDYYKYSDFNGLTRQRVLNMNDCVGLFLVATKYIESIKFKKENYNNVSNSIMAMNNIIDFLKTPLNRRDRRMAYRKIELLKEVSSSLSGLSNLNHSSINSISGALSEIKSIDISKVQAVTHMFNAFGEINKSENIISKFTESVKEFTETCGKLMNAMGQNTDAINNMDTSNRNLPLFDNTTSNMSSSTETDSNNTNNQIGGIRIANVDELARTFAEKINGALSIDVPDTQVQLLINGTGGNEWTITRY
jgi:hypothetical protein